VDLKIFSVRGDDYGRGVAGFSGKLCYPLPISVQDEADRLMKGWGCGIFAVKNALALLRIEATSSELMQRALSLGLNPDGVDTDIVNGLLKQYGLGVREKNILSINGARQITDGGGVILTTVISQDWTKAHRSSWQTYDSHWLVIPSADQERVLVMDSELREEGVGSSTYGVYTMSWSSFSKRNCYYVGGLASVSLDFVWGESLWYYHDILVVNR